ncbi:MAG: hypothetical protein MH321_08030 [Leptospiraceae bacterium]|nr:hypothetical protein [Leptospiraceae bacterium]
MEGLFKEWKAFRKSLRLEDQVFFDDFFRIVNENIQAGNAQGHPFPMETAFLTVIIELLKKNYNLRQEVEQLKMKVISYDGGESLKRI